MSFDLVYYNDNYSYFEDYNNHFSVFNLSDPIQYLEKSNNLFDENTNNLDLENILKTIFDLTNNNKNININNEQTIKTIAIIFVITQIYLLLKKTKT